MHAPRRVRRRWHLVPVLCAGLALALTSVLPSGASDPVSTQPLFRIERSKNANVVQYDARVLAGGGLDPSEPIDAYWIRLAGDGSRRELDWLQRRLAYGFDARIDAGGTAATLDMVADIGREITVRAVDGAYRAEIEIDGRRCVLERVFVQSLESGILPRVVSIDLFGSDVTTGENRSERLHP